MTYLYSQSKWTQEKKKKNKKIASISDKIWAPELELIVGGGEGGTPCVLTVSVDKRVCSNEKLLMTGRRCLSALITSSDHDLINYLHVRRFFHLCFVHGWL